MNIIKNLERIALLHKLIKEERTGSPEKLSRRLDLSRASLYNLLDELKSLDAPISYSRNKESFYYSSPFELELNFKVTGISNSELVKIDGGNKSFSFRLIF